ncbi:hypothetical protein [Edaphobacter aggregans]|uniref:hypothetical protein n=1 Tax=Edaphobacter aggregans TaxID=570835 RepID=UPI0012F72B1C|nr:hypothetical protein [Edaphobacter aggregans]
MNEAAKGTVANPSTVQVICPFGTPASFAYIDRNPTFPQESEYGEAKWEAVKS